MNMNDLAKMICDLEGKKKPVTVAQVKEVLGCLAQIMKQHPAEVQTLLWKYASKK
jgi:hypothetical protein